MSELSASSMLTWYLATKRRMISVVTQPRLREATKPAKLVSACLGNRYWVRTANRSDTRRLDRGRKGHSIDAQNLLPVGYRRLTVRDNPPRQAPPPRWADLARTAPRLFSIRDRH